MRLKSPFRDSVFGPSVSICLPVSIRLPICIRPLVSTCLLVSVCLFVSGCASTIPGPKYMARHERALRLYQEKRYPETLTELQPILIHFPFWVDGSLLYARAAMATETIAGRRLASEILERLVSNYPDRTDLRQELAFLCFKQDFFDYARGQYAVLLKANKEDSQSHYMLGIILQKDWERYHKKNDLFRMIAEFSSATETDTLNKDAFSRLAVAYLETGRPDSMQLVLDRMLRSFPSDADATMLNAIAYRERGEYERSLKEWNRLFSFCDVTIRDVFDDIDLLLTPQQRTKLNQVGKVEREEFVRRFWKELDPTPTTELNERILEHWRRVGLSKVLFTVEATGTPGWLTGPGQALIRYGFPDSGEYAWARDGQGLALPMLTWHYVDEYGPFDVVFVDYTLSGGFQCLHHPADFPRWKTLTAFEKRAYYNPTHYDHDYGAQVFEILFANAGFLRDAGVQEEFYVGIPLEQVTKGDWKKVPFEAVIFDSLWNELSRVSATLDGAHTYAEPGVGGILIRELSLGLAPGRYVVALTVTDSVSRTLGLTKESITVPSLSRDILGISDIELAYLIPERRVETWSSKDKGILPNPSRTYVAPSSPKFYYEIYNLARDYDGKYRFTTKYAIIPSWKGGGTIWGFLVSLFGRNSTTS